MTYSTDTGGLYAARPRSARRSSHFGACIVVFRRPFGAVYGTFSALECLRSSANALLGRRRQPATIGRCPPTRCRAPPPLCSAMSWLTMRRCIARFSMFSRHRNVSFACICVRTMSSSKQIRYSQERLIATLPALHLRRAANASHPFLRASGLIPRLTRITILPTKREYISSTRKEPTKQPNLLRSA